MGLKAPQLLVSIRCKLSKDNENKGRTELHLAVHRLPPIPTLTRPPQGSSPGTEHEGQGQ